MADNPRLIPYIAELIQHGKTLQYKNRYGAQEPVTIQPLAALDKLNSDSANLAKMRDLGVHDALVIGADAAGIPILIACQTLKTYLLDPDLTTSGSYLKNEIVLTH
jgi:hypothetical protein